MSESTNDKAEASAEKAYAMASESVSPEKSEASAMEIPSVKAEAAAKPKPKTAAKRKAPAARKKPVAKAKPKAAPKPKSATAAPKAKPVVAKKPAPAKKPATVSAAAVAAPKVKKFPVKPNIPAIAKTKDITMSMKDKITGSVETMISEAQAKAKEAFEKSSALLGGYAEFTKGNVEALVESGKILAEGLQDMSTNLVAEGRATFETVSADMKEMAAAKSPTDLMQLQSEMVRKSFDNAVAYSSKNTEAMLKIASDAIAPISGRVSLAMDKVRKIAA